MSTWFDVAVVSCPSCGNYFVDASWFLIDLESDIQCGHCQTEFNGKNNTTDHLLLEFTIDEDGKMKKVRIAGETSIRIAFVDEKLQTVFSNL